MGDIIHLSEERLRRDKNYVPYGVGFYLHAILIVTFAVATVSLYVLDAVPRSIYWWCAGTAAVILVVVATVMTVTSVRMYRDDRADR